MTARSVVLEQVAGLGTSATVMPYARNVDSIGGPTLMVRVDQVDHDPSVRVWRRYTVALLVIVPQTDIVADAEDELDGLLEDVLYELEQDTTPLTWTTARRAVFQEQQWPCYEVTLSVPIAKESTP
jgi:hypothetical protein